MSRALVGHVYELMFNRISKYDSIPWIGCGLILKEKGQVKMGGFWLYDVLVSDDQGDLFTIEDFTFRAERTRRIT